MKDRYHINFSSYTLKKFRKSIAHREMIPSRQILKENLQENFQLFERLGMHSVQDLLDRIKTKDKLVQFAEDIELPEGYLVVLKREIGAFKAKPVKLADIPGIEERLLKRLEEEGIKNTRHMFDESETLKMKMNLCKRLSLSLNEIEEVAALSDLSRVYGVGPVFARILYDIGIKSLKELASTKPMKIIKIYEDHTGEKADFKEDDLKLTIDMAKELLEA